MFVTEYLLVQFAAILALLLTKHFLADYVLQNKYMLRKGNVKGWFMPLVAHCGVHGALTAAVLVAYCGWAALAIALMEAVTHFVIDYLKAQKLKYHQFDKRFWIALGADQFAHQLTYLAIAFFVALGYLQ